MGGRVCPVDEEFRDLVNIDDLRTDILSMTFGRTGYSYVMETSGMLVIHPKLQGTNIIDSRDADGRMFIKEMTGKKSGAIVYPWKNPGDTLAREKLVVFNDIPELKWIVASSSYLEEFYHPLSYLRTAVATTLLVTLGLVLIVSYTISGGITGQLRLLMSRFSAGAAGDFTTRVDNQSRDEIGRLAGYFNTFMERFETYQADLKAEINDRRKAQEALSEAHEKLEQRVADRTLELETANRALTVEMNEKLLAEAALRRQMALMETVINTIPNLVFCKDATGKYIGCNTAFARQILGLAPAAVIGRSLADLHPRIPRDLAETYRHHDGVKIIDIDRSSNSVPQPEPSVQHD